MDIGQSPLVPSSRPVVPAAIWSIAAGAASLIPFLGIIAGPLAILFSWYSRHRLEEGSHNGRHAAMLGGLLGALGLLISILWVINFIVPASDFSGEKAITVRQDLVRNASALELHASLYSSYPENLEALELKGLNPVLVDPYLYEYVYSVSDNGLSYKLLSSGPDGIIGSVDDIEFSRDLAIKLSK